jgi:hypothetical protein
MIYDFRNRMATHQPVLWAVAHAAGGPIAEFGSGNGSTPLLHAIASRLGVRLVTLDNDASWLERYRQSLESPLHEFRLVEDWSVELARPEWDENWAVVFIDQNPFEARALTVARFRSSADYLVVHDDDYFAERGLFGVAIRPLLGPHDRGERDFSDTFSSWCEFFPPEPWPFRPTGPPTLLGSNRRDVTTIRVDYEDHLPLWWRVGRHTRRLLPQPLAMRLANRAGWGRS